MKNLHPCAASDCIGGMGVLYVGWTVVVFDTDRSRGSDICCALEQCKTPYDIQIHSTGDLSVLKSMIARSEVDVIFCDIRLGSNADAVCDMVHETVDRDTFAQIVYTGVSEERLVSAEQRDHAFLLPNTPSIDDVSCAINKSIALQSKMLERPLLVRVRGRDRTIPPGKVSYIESDLRKVRIHLGNEMVEAYGKLSAILQKLPRRFIQCHKSFVVNLGFVVELNREYLVLTDGERIPVSQKRRKRTREAYTSYVGRTLQ